MEGLKPTDVESPRCHANSPRSMHIIHVNLIFAVMRFKLGRIYRMKQRHYLMT